MTTASSGGVWFLAEAEAGALTEATLGLAALARELAQRLGRGTAAVLLGEGSAPLARQVPADAVYLLRNVPAGTPPAGQAAALAQIIARERPEAFLLVASHLGEELAPRLAARLGTGLAPRCIRLQVESDGVLLMLRPAYGGRASCTVICPTARPQMATLCPEALAGRRAQGAPAEVIAVDAALPADEGAVAVEGVGWPEPEALDPGEAEVVVAGGRGMGRSEAFRLLWELAACLGGTVAASRPAVDAGWAPRDRQVGSSGRVIAPRLYIACGISGASQHLVGIRGAGTVVAINRDAVAPIFSLAELALVADVHELLPPLVRELKGMAGAVRGRLPPLPPPDPGLPPLRIAVCLSGGIDPEAPLELRPECAAGPRILNPGDAAVLEAALRLRDQTPGSRVTALALGEPGPDLLRLALAAGADEAVHLDDEAFAGSDTLATARIVSRAAQRLNADLLLCGLRSLDGGTGSLPGQAAELLGWPCLSRVTAFSLQGEGIRLQCSLPGGRRALLRSRLPAVLAMEGGAYQLRYPPLRDRLRAEGRALPCWGAAELGLPADSVGARGSPTRVVSVGPPKPIARGFVPVDDSLSAEERLQQILSGGLSSPRRQQQGEKVLRGPPEELARRLAAFLAERGFLAGRE